MSFFSDCRNSAGLNRAAPGSDQKQHGALRRHSAHEAHASMPRVRVIALVLLTWIALAAQAEACACCTNPGQRTVQSVRFDTTHRAQFQDLKFAPGAELYLGEGDPEQVKGVAQPSAHYTLGVTVRPEGLSFAFSDKAGRSGTLSLAYPETLSRFEVDPREGKPDSGLGPTLYKEWKLTAKAVGTGIFAPGTGRNQRITFILQGRGNSCTDVTHFTAWTLVVHGPAAEFSLFGALSPTP
jgi:hypothetical protein